MKKQKRQRVTAIAPLIILVGLFISLTCGDYDQILAKGKEPLTPPFTAPVSPVPPVITTNKLRNARVGMAYQSQLTATDYNRDLEVATVQGLPQGLESSCGNYNGQFIKCQLYGIAQTPGSYSVIFTVSDSKSQVARKVFDLQVR